MGVYLGWFGRGTRLVHYGSRLSTPLGRLPAARRALDALARRIQRSRSGPRTQGIVSDVVAVAADARGRTLATVHLTGRDPYSFTAPMLAWAAITAAGDGVRPPGALGPVEAFGIDSLESACAAAGFHRERPREPLDDVLSDDLPDVRQGEMQVHRRWRCPRSGPCDYGDGMTA